MHRTIDGRHDPANDPANDPAKDPAKDPHRQAGMVGKALVVWLLIMAVLAVGIIDAVSIARTTLHASEVAAVAASDGAAAYQSGGRSAVRACEAVAAAIAAHDRSLKLGRNGCTVDEVNGRVTVTIKTVATTFLAGRLGPTEQYTLVVVREANGGANV
jgi:hypothetical protein